jgi:hypothetical protein
MGALTAADLKDSLHPNDNGYKKMADAFDQGVIAAANDGWITKPTGGGTTATTGFVKGQESGRCVDVPGASQTNGTAPALWDCNGGGNQTWTATSSSQLQVYGNKCLDATGHGTSDGTTVVIWDCTGGSNQQWTVNSDGSIVGTESGKCLDATGHGTSNGTKLVLWGCNGGGNQKWSRS